MSLFFWQLVWNLSLIFTPDNPQCVFQAMTHQLACTTDLTLLFLCAVSSAFYCYYLLEIMFQAPPCYFSQTESVMTLFRTLSPEGNSSDTITHHVFY